MAITIDGGTNTISGLAVGGLPDGVVDGDMLASGVGGKILQCIPSTLKTDSFTTSSSSFVDVTGMTATITPSATSSKILILVMGRISIATDGAATWTQLLRGSTVIGSGDTGESTTEGIGYCQTSPASAGNRKLYDTHVLMVDEPSTTSATVYKMQMKGGSWNITGATGSGYGNTSSQITLLEIGV
jgi:hypothetical protein